MENTIEKDLFVYVNLEDQSQTLSLLNNYRLLFNWGQEPMSKSLKTTTYVRLQDQGRGGWRQHLLN